jgi:hypothetical protein
MDKNKIKTIDHCSSCEHQWQESRYCNLRIYMCKKYRENLIDALIKCNAGDQR